MRTARKLSESGIYHVVIRGNNKQTIFLEDEDCLVFLNRIKLTQKSISFDLYAYCLMSNHVHLIIKEEAELVGKIMQSILTSFVLWYNTKYERVGTLFQDRFKSEPIENDSHLLSAVRYVHQNPLRAGIVSDIKDYRWSSFEDYHITERRLVNTSFVLEMFDNDIEHFDQFNAEMSDDKFIDADENTNRISDAKLIDEIKKLKQSGKFDTSVSAGVARLYSVANIMVVHEKDIAEVIECLLKTNGGNRNQLARVSGMPAHLIRKH
jgi:REP element-mobilizing transposase RayT